MRMPGNRALDATLAEVEYRTEELRKAGGRRRAHRTELPGQRAESQERARSGRRRR
ncbi:hypothetical protein SacmaDRAFT_2203 [Saccharomonospora marina XMU15]|uniref:Uncharacterized protein n=1 Tax=Saccharomonospora marina XMU15 TaxID=882083 RepID=H5XBF0_9PSEU|nr:hypothetical protein [Saccharomonospora marina]EHR50457.1 hypothetical protein SacmaDRAFT_2203 [Saccharomonospora marina XMU15]